MKWIKDQYISETWLCPKCGAMVQGDGYGGIQYEFCPYCGRAIEPVKAEEAITGKGVNDMLDIDAAIKHCLEVARTLQDKADTLTGEESRNCMECSADHIQLAEWLRDFKKAKELLRDIKSYYRSDSECKEYKCADCIHFDECGYGKQHPNGYKWRFEDNVNALIGGSDESTN